MAMSGFLSVGPGHIPDAQQEGLDRYVFIQFGPMKAGATAADDAVILLSRRRRQQAGKIRQWDAEPTAIR